MSFVDRFARSNNPDSLNVIPILLVKGNLGESTGCSMYYLCSALAHEQLLSQLEAS